MLTVMFPFDHSCGITGISLQSMATFAREHNNTSPFIWYWGSGGDYSVRPQKYWVFMCMTDLIGTCEVDHQQEISDEV